MSVGDGTISVQRQRSLTEAYTSNELTQAGP